MFSFGFVVIVVGVCCCWVGGGRTPNALLIKDKTEKEKGLVRNPYYNSHASEVWYIFVLYSYARTRDSLSKKKVDGVTEQASFFPLYFMSLRLLTCF